MPKNKIKPAPFHPPHTPPLLFLSQCRLAKCPSVHSDSTCPSTQFAKAETGMLSNPCHQRCHGIIDPLLGMAKAATRVRPIQSLHASCGWHSGSDNGIMSHSDAYLSFGGGSSFSIFFNQMVFPISSFCLSSHVPKFKSS